MLAWWSLDKKGAVEGIGGGRDQVDDDKISNREKRGEVSEV
jgi:hypothetical protein